MSNIESLNVELIKKGIKKSERFLQLREMAVYQLKILDKKNALKAIKKLADHVYIEQQKKLDKQKRKSFDRLQINFAPASKPTIQAAKLSD